MLRWIVRSVLALLLLAAAALGWLVSGKARGPNVEGTLRVSGLSEKVEVLRDANGIPYVFANNLPDLIRAQGFVTAQARIFQMEAYRAIASGRLAEAIGEKGLGNDREIRTIGLVRNAERHARLLAPAARDFLTWYAEGLNAYIAQHAADLPTELKLAGFTATPWTLRDMLIVVHYVNWSQAVNYKTELVMQKLIDKLGPDRAAQLYPVNLNPDRRQPLAGVAVAPDAAGAMRLGLSNDATVLAASTQAPEQAPLALGSNNWAIAPARAASGAAVLTNDPHLDARVLPGIWMPIGLFSPQLRAVGGALPATPGLMSGRNEHVAFGVTNAYGDSQDLFIEQLAPGKPDHYLDGDKVLPFEKRVETIRVKDDAAPGGFREEQLTIRHTLRGPVVIDKPLGPGGDRLLSLRMASAELDGKHIGIDRLLAAKNAAEVDQAVQQMEAYYFNFVFADKAGVIGHRATGRVPVRKSGHGLHPKPVGAQDDWQGVIPPERMPGTIAPERGWVATANHDTRPDGYAWDYSSYFAPSYRIERIGQVLDASRGMTTQQQRALMTDTQNLQVPRLLPAILGALKVQPEHADLLAILSAWDGRDRADQAAPLVYHLLYKRIAYETFVDDLGEELTAEYLKNWYLWQIRFDKLAEQADSPWFDDQRTPARETLADLVKRAAVQVRQEIASRQGADPKAWRWGTEHRLQFDSPLRRSGLGRDFLGRPPQPFDGSGDTVMRALNTSGKGYDAEFFGSMRLVADLADDQKLMAVVSGGVVERQFHPHQKNQLDPWFAGELLPWWFERKAVEANARTRQVLEPAAK